MPSTRPYVPGSSSLRGTDLKRHDKMQEPMSGKERVQRLAGVGSARSDMSLPSGSKPTELQFMKQKTQLKETCVKAVQPCVGIKSIVKLVEVADSKLPKSPPPSFVVPTNVSSGFFCEPFLSKSFVWDDSVCNLIVVEHFPVAILR